jgi:putative transposase
VCRVETLLDASNESFVQQKALIGRVTQHRRRLPHLYPKDKDLFVTWSLHGVLPASFRVRPGKLVGGEAFVWMDRQLDILNSGPMYLRQPAIAKVVVNSIHIGVQLAHYDLHAYVVMANHVHLLTIPTLIPVGC